MARYTLRRLIILIPTVLVVIVICFTLLYFTPGDPAIIILGQTASAQEMAECRENLGLNQPYIVRLGSYLYDLIINFDLGTSWVYMTDVKDELLTRLGYTVWIAVFSVMVGAVIGIPLGVLAATHQNRLPDKIVLVLSSVMKCIPGFCIALLLILFFGLRLGWLPVNGVRDGLKSYILPCISIMIGSFADLSRQMRSSMLEVIRSDYVRAAKAQGFSKNAVNYTKALPNAMIPVITILGTSFAHGLGGTMILEIIFSIPGVGAYVATAVSSRDQPVVLGSVVFLSVTFCVIMVLVDLAYAAVDPRIKAQFIRKAAKR